MAAAEAVVHVEIGDVEPFKGLVEAAVNYRRAFAAPAFVQAEGISALAKARNDLFTAIDAVRDAGLYTD